MSPSKQKKLFICQCGNQKIIRVDVYNSNVKRNGQYLCHHCACVKAGKDGKYSHTKEIRSKQSKAMWADGEFRDKVTNSNKIANSAEEYKQIQSDRTKKLWEDTEYKQSISDSVKIAMQSLELRGRISAALCDRYHNDPQYRIAVGLAAKARFADDEYRKRMAIIRSNQPRISSLQIMLYKYLDDLSIDYYKEGKETSIGWYVFDCFVPSHKLLIECQGNYWHSIKIAQSRDKAKFTYINKYFPEYEIMYVWEHEFSAASRVLDRLKLKLNIDVEQYDFDFDDIKIRDDINVKQFLDCYHYIGGNRGGKAISATINGDIIACSLFSPLLRQNMSEMFGDSLELSRFCIHPSYHKKNFASWFLARCLKIINKSIVSYSDTTVGHNGTIYKAGNFKYHHTVQPDYWYVDNDGYVMHKKTLYERAVNLKMSESEFADKFGYVRKYGGPKLCFVYNR